MLKMDVVEERENKFLKRKDLMINLDHKGEATPKKDDLIAKIAEKFKADPKKIEII